jgi:DNA-binding beta-propeller fold protein YncE
LVNTASSEPVVYYRFRIISLIVLGFVISSLFYCTAVNAQGPLVRHFVTLDFDADGKPLSRPSFAQYEPYMDEIYVIDGKNRIIIYTSDLFPVLTLGLSRKIVIPHGLTVAPDGRLYVAQGQSSIEDRYKISVFNPCLKWERDIFFEGFEGAESFVPFRLALDRKGNLYVAGVRYHGVLVYDSDYNLIDIMSPEEDGRKSQIINVTIDDAGWIYLVSEEKGHIYVFDENREFIYQFGEKGGSSGKLSRPRAVGVDNIRGWLYVVDYMRHTVNAYDRSGNLLFEFGGMGWGEGWFRFPTDISVNKDGDVMISDLFNQRIQIFKPY